MPRAVGLDLGTRLLKLVELKGSGKSFKIVRLVVRPLPEPLEEDPEAPRIDLVRTLFAEYRLPKDDVCSSFDAGTTVFRDVTMPYKGDDQLDKTVRFEAENHLHGRAIEDVVVSWVKTGETRDGSQLIVMAAPKGELVGRLGLLRRAGVEPASVDLDVTALFTACEAAGVFAEHPSCIVLDLGSRTTGMLVVDAGRPKAIRAFQVGADTIGASLSQDLALPVGEAAARSLRAGRDPDALLVPATTLAPSQRETSKSVAELEEDAATARREEFVRKVQREIMRSVASSRSESAPSVVLVCGGGSLVPGVPEALAARLALPVEPLRILDRLGHQPDDEHPELTQAVAPIAIGCALRLLGRNPLGVELRQDEFAPSNTFEVVRTALAIAVTLLVALLAGVAFVTREAADRAQAAFLGTKDSVAKQAARILQTVEETYQQTVKGKSAAEAQSAARKLGASIPGDENYLIGVRNHLLRRYRELEQDLGLSKDVPTIQSALKVQREVYAAFNAIPRAELGFFRITKMAISQSSATLTLEVDDASTLDKVVRALATNDYLKGRAKDPNKVVQPGNLQINQQTKRSTVSLEIPFDDEGR